VLEGEYLAKREESVGGEDLAVGSRGLDQELRQNGECQFAAPDQARIGRRCFHHFFTVQCPHKFFPLSNLEFENAIESVSFAVLWPYGHSILKWNASLADSRPFSSPSHGIVVMDPN
jgi:hypothetical protein